MVKLMLFYSLGSTVIGVLLGVFGFRIEVVIVASMLGAPVIHLLWIVARTRGIVP